MQSSRPPDVDLGPTPLRRPRCPRPPRHRQCRGRGPADQFPGPARRRVRSSSHRPTPPSSPTIAAPFAPHVVEPDSTDRPLIAGARLRARPTPGRGTGPRRVARRAKAAPKTVVRPGQAPRSSPAKRRRPSLPRHLPPLDPGPRAQPRHLRLGLQRRTHPEPRRVLGLRRKNNLYLLGHAWGVFAPIHDGYHSGALKVGLTAWYADKSGDVHRYRIS